MVCDGQSELHAPALRILVTGKLCLLAMLISTTHEVQSIGKSEWAHWHFFHWMLVPAKLKFDLARTCLDFEKSLVSAAKD